MGLGIRWVKAAGSLHVGSRDSGLRLAMSLWWELPEIRAPALQAAEGPKGLGFGVLEFRDGV